MVCKASSGESFKVRHTPRAEDAEKHLLRQLGMAVHLTLNPKP